MSAKARQRGMKQGREAAADWIAKMARVSSLHDDEFMAGLAAGLAMQAFEYLAETQGKVFAAEILTQLADDACAAVPPDQIPRPKAIRPNKRTEP